MPGGAARQPSASATMLVYSLLVAQATNFLAASCFWLEAGMARFHAHSQLPWLSTPSLLGNWAKLTLSATVESSGSVTKLAATVASIHMPHLPCWNSDRFSLKPFEDAPGGPYSFIKVR